MVLSVPLGMDVGWTGEGDISGATEEIGDGDSFTIISNESFEGDGLRHPAAFARNITPKRLAIITRWFILFL